MADEAHGEPPALRPRLPFRRRGIYLLPNMFTTGVLFGGFYAIVQAMNGRFELAAFAIFVAMVLDGMDGRVARWTRTQSEFGAQYDSLADCVAFGVAPGLVLYEWTLKGMGNLGWAAAFFYCACTAIRLARFNANIGVVDKRYFQGLPSPSGAAVVAGFVWLIEDFALRGSAWLPYAAWVVAVFAGSTMVSSAPYYSFKELNVRKSVPFWVILVLIIGIAVISLSPPALLFLMFFGYALSGYIMWMRGVRAKPPPA
jgi:CDP-diacylglycerol--serine O-phosphatidyltransferase